LNQELIDEFIEEICNLAKVNRLTGIWDHVRNYEANKSFEIASKVTLIKSELNSRKNVELRAYSRKRLDWLMSKFVQDLAQK